MSPLRIAFGMLIATTGFAQSDEIAHRLRMALPSAGSAELACTALAHHDFAKIEQILADLKPPTPAGRSAILALEGAVEFLDGKLNSAARDFQKASELSPLNDADTFTFAMALVNLDDEAHARQLLTDRKSVV